MNKLIGITICIMLSLALVIGDVYAEDAAIQELQTDVSITKSKADKNAAEIESLKGGLPAEKETRIAADEYLQSQIDNIELLPIPPGTNSGETIVSTLMSYTQIEECVVNEKGSTTCKPMGVFEVFLAHGPLHLEVTTDDLTFDLEVVAWTHTSEPDSTVHIECSSGGYLWDYYLEQNQPIATKSNNAPADIIDLIDLRATLVTKSHLSIAIAGVTSYRSILRESIPKIIDIVVTAVSDTEDQLDVLILNWGDNAGPARFIVGVKNCNLNIEQEPPAQERYMEVDAFRFEHFIFNLTQEQPEEINQCEVFVQAPSGRIYEEEVVIF